MFDGFEMGLWPLVARPALLELLGPDAPGAVGAWTARVLAVFLVGAALGGFVFGWLGDRIGRVRAMALSILCYSLFSGLGAFATEPWHLLVSRALAALGMGGEWALGVALVMEVWPGASRPLLAGAIGAAANVGFLLCALAGVALSTFVHDLAALLDALGLSADTIAWLLGGAGAGWRLLLLLGAAPALLTVLVRACVPESSKWEHAVQAGGRPRFAEVFQGLNGRRALQGSLLATVALLGMWGSTQWLPSLGDRLVQGRDPAARAWTQVYAAAGQIAGSLLAAAVAAKLSRRASYAVLCVAALAANAAVFRLDLGFGKGFLVLCAFAGAASASFFGWLPLYLPELFPTRLRATGQGFAFNAGRIIAAAGTLGAGALVDAFGGDYARMGATMSLAFGLGLLVIPFCPETRGRPLPD